MMPGPAISRSSSSQEFLDIETIRYSEGTSMGTYTSRYLQEVAEIAKRIDQAQVKRIIDVLIETRNNKGRLFILGVGGGAGNATHAVNDFRKIANIEIGRASCRERV